MCVYDPCFTHKLQARADMFTRFKNYCLLYQSFSCKPKGFIALRPGGGEVGAGGLELGGSTHLAERVGVGQRPANSGF